MLVIICQCEYQGKAISIMLAACFLDTLLLGDPHGSRVREQGNHKLDSIAIQLVVAL